MVNTTVLQLAHLKWLGVNENILDDNLKRKKLRTTLTVHLSINIIQCKSTALANQNTYG